MMKVMHIITGLNDGGAEAILHRICTHDKKNTHIVVSMMDKGKYGPMLQEVGIKVFCLGMPRGKLTFNGLWGLRKIIKNKKPDVVQTWMYHANLVGGIIARIGGIKSVCWGIHNGALTPETAALSTIAVSKLSALLSRVVPSSIICCSKNSVEVHKKAGYSKDKLVYIPNGYDITKFSPNGKKRTKVRKELGLGEEDVLLGMVARYDPLKDHANLIKALSMLKRSRKDNFYCALVGTDIDIKNIAIEEEIRRGNLTDKMILLGRRDDISDLMNAFDIHILSSQSEAFPNVLAEAMACGTPCVTTDVGDAAVIVGQTGWVVPPKSPKALAKAIGNAIEESKKPERWSEKKIKARDRIRKNFEIDCVVEKYEDYWNKVVMAIKFRCSLFLIN